MAINPGDWLGWWIKDRPAEATAAALRACADEVEPLLDEGFLLPAPAVIQRAAEVFSALQSSSIHQMGVRAELLVGVWRDYSIHRRAMDDAIDLSWSNTWSLHESASRPWLELAMTIQSRLMAGESQALVDQATREINTYMMLNR